MSNPCGRFWSGLFGRGAATAVPAVTWGRAANHAKGWWPTGVSIGRPIYGAIATKEREGGGHVPFVMGKDPKDPATHYCLGGNQGNKLQVSRYKASDFHAFLVSEGYAHSCCVLPDYNGLAQAAGSEA